MGMYTEINCRICLDENVPEGVVKVLKYMVGDVEDISDEELPEHDLFKTPRWDTMLRSSSFYHIPKSNMELFYSDIGSNWYLIGRSDLKNYDDEIEMFFDWIKPYCEFSEEMIGYSLYEEFNEPTIYKS